MLKENNKRSTIILLLLPLLLISICFFTVYSSDISTYYQNYDEIITNSFPDYLTFNENASFIHTPKFQRDTVIQEFSLEDYTHLGFFSCETALGDKNFPLMTIIWAPSSFYEEYLNLSLLEGEIFVGSSLRNEYFNYTTTLFASFKPAESLIINSSFTLKNFIQTEDIFIGKMLSNLQGDKLGTNGKYICMTDDTFNTIFSEHLNNFCFYNIFMFKFERETIYSLPIDQITKFLDTNERNINSYFEYQTDSDLIFIQFSLKWQLERFDEQYSGVKIFQMLIIYLVVTFLATISLAFTVESYITNQRATINLFRLRGGKRYDIFKKYFNIELKLIILTSLIVYIFSIGYIAIVAPAFLHFNTNFFKLAGSVLAFVILCGSIQIFMLVRYISQKKTVEHSSTVLMQKMKNIIKDLLFSLIPTLFCVLLYFFLFALLLSNEVFVNYWILGLFYIAMLMLSFIITRNRILRVGTLIFSAFSKLYGIFSYTKEFSQKVLLKRLKMSKLLIVYIIILSLFISMFDSINSYETRNEVYNEVGDLTIVYPKSSSFQVQQILAQYIDLSIEFSHFIIKKQYIDAENSIRNIRIDSYILNHSKIDDLFECEKFKKFYAGLEDLEIIKSKFHDSNATIVSETLSSELQKEIGNTLILKIATHSTYRAEIIDIVEILPVFSWISMHYFFPSAVSNYILLNNEFTENISELEDSETWAILIMNNSCDRNQLIEIINNLNNNLHLGISIIDFGETNLIDEDYAGIMINSTQIVIIIVILSVALSFFTSEYCKQMFSEQLNGFRVFFARGVSIRKGLFLALVPVLLFIYYITVIGNIFGWLLTFIISSEMQPFDYLKVRLSIFPYSLLFLVAQLSLLTIITCITGYLNYKKLKSRLPEIISSDNLTIKLEES